MLPPCVKLRFRVARVVYRGQALEFDLGSPRVTSGSALQLGRVEGVTLVGIRASVGRNRGR